MKEGGAWKFVACVLAFGLILAPVITGYFFPFAFDDAFISFRITENLVETGRPYFAQNEAVYTSTSLFYPYWNALWALFLGSGWTDWMNVVNGALLGLATGRVLYVLFKKCTGYPAFSIAVLVVAPLALSATQLGFGNTGLETALYECVLVFTILPPISGSPKITGFGWIAGFIRPEGFLAGFSGFFGDVMDGKCNRAIRNILLAGVVFGIWAGISLFLYGTLVPQSIVAKSNHRIIRFNEIKWGFANLVFQGKGLYTLLIGFSLYQFPALRSEFRLPLIWLVSYALFFSLIAAWWPWYIPPMLIPLMYMAGRSATLWVEDLKMRAEVAAFVCFVLLVFSTISFKSALQTLRIQSDAYAVRKKSSEGIGRWITSHLLHTERILLEPLGLIGYFAPKARILDYPGLASIEMSGFVKRLPWKIPRSLTEPGTDSAVIGHFSPEFLLLFPAEENGFRVIGQALEYVKVDSLPYYPADPRFYQVVFYRKRLHD